ncbi:2-phosphosulfolactate phosphatase [Streptomyces lincolnensis]|uniref:Probable 2-phosphosulfolactate phosphatase n=1 Tax=Streptomyces lincolnensis TaxID=1915 RepID=A0A1B1MGG9_STRLN|nr:2-phosphosulfolactate phosphatase [Streptomyces lincolnensis]AXG54928.1 2-phosphosulfolactate phosphatase [Streptomyces lincolnensis]QMV12565.1 2-phosphosulfolactate phosphatase [Streptomyces lincolnensis]
MDGTEQVAVVIDVMRAFTTAAWAFHRGATKIVLAADQDEALAIKARHPTWLALKDGALVSGFDLVNSPGQIREADLTGHTVIQKTTAGTVGALAVVEAELALCASFAVAGATAQALADAGADSVTFVATGEDGHAAEDLACADYLHGLLTGNRPDPAPCLHRARTSPAAADLRAGRRHGAHPADVELCLEVDRFDFAMKLGLEDEMAVLRPLRTRPDAKNGRETAIRPHCPNQPGWNQRFGIETCPVSSRGFL